MKLLLDRFYSFLDQPIVGWARVVIALAVIPLALAFTQPLWRISMEAPQYPDGLEMSIYSYKLVGGDHGHDISEINELNHYIGMHKITRQELKDLDWLPFALGLLILVALRTAAIGNVRTLIDLAVLSSYVLLVAFGRFIYTLYRFGHDLDPHAPIHLAPFTPVIIGTRQIANFTTQSVPSWGSALVGLFMAAVVGVTLYHLVSGRLRARRALVARAA